ncbi:hypothetical protein DICSQDRAFT_173082 [Dichomitus squalens LYAD-421 SS1]|uniref:Uncharacterized protein n=1 Tax=Dichomitus squalens (strain LYAD-421) TaxID=732165 RepID=R7SQR4_DICSQ|nr:uncharacterized protein DICSQDRAFT_173082 [Dichomitus squalens LYAD-421 SS1]EJF58258.1 hypothetical protein DICSQDRAFT_173082 [Dichomitus squalens LYAD-421 SS1]
MEAIEGENIARMMMMARYDMRAAKVAVPKPFVHGDVRAPNVVVARANSRAYLVDLGGLYEPIQKEHDRYMLALLRRNLLAMVGEQWERL